MCIPWGRTRTLPQFSSATQSFLTLCHPMDWSMPGLPVQHQFPEFTQIHVHPAGDAIQHLILCHLLLRLPSIFPSIRVFSMSQLFTSGDQSIGASASVSVLPVNIQGWFPFWLTGLISLQSKGLSSVFSNATVQGHQFFGAQPLYGPALTSIPDYWKNHSLDYIDLCKQSDVSTF